MCKAEQIFPSPSPLQRPAPQAPANQGFKNRSLPYKAMKIQGSTSKKKYENARQRSQHSANQRTGIAWPSLSEYNTISLTEKLCPAKMKKIFKSFLTPPLYGTLPVPPLWYSNHHRPVRVTRGALVAHRYTYAPPRCRTSQYCRTFIPSQCLSGMVLMFLCSMVWD